MWLSNLLLLLTGLLWEIHIGRDFLTQAGGAIFPEMCKLWTLPPVLVRKVTRQDCGDGVDAKTFEEHGFKFKFILRKEI